VKVQCPYCAHRFPPDRRPRCPACGKSVLMPGFYRNPRSRPRPAAPPGNHLQPASINPLHLLMASRPAAICATLLLLAMATLPIIRHLRSSPEPGTASRIRLAHDNMAVLHIALDQLHRDTGRYPLTTEGLVGLIHNPGRPGWNGPYILELKPDPWNRRFEYESDGQEALLYSAGPDGMPGTGDDLSHPVSPP